MVDKFVKARLFYGPKHGRIMVLPSPVTMVRFPAWIPTASLAYYEDDQPPTIEIDTLDYELIGSSDRTGERIYVYFFVNS